MEATAQAQPNIALVKYWGKRDVVENLPAVGSLSVTLDALWTRTRVTFDSGLNHDKLSIDGVDAPVSKLERVSLFLDLLRQRAGKDIRASVVSENNFPADAGLASSASAFAALVTAASEALGLNLSAAERSRIARRGSGSAARSVFGGFVEMPGPECEPSDSCAVPLLEAGEWPLEVVVAVTSYETKTVGSTEGMQRTAATSPYYQAWIDSQSADLNAAHNAVLGKDFDALGRISEQSCLKMHGLMMSADPGLVYWNSTTVDCINHIRDLRAQGLPVFFTIDAGPQVKAICLPGHGNAVRETLADLPGVLKVFLSDLGAGARIEEATP